MSATSPVPPDGPPGAAPPAAPPGGGQSDDGSSDDSTGKIEQLKIIGGLVALGVGLLALIIVVVVALLVKPDTTGGSIATAAIGVIGSIVGAYFGVKIGSDGTQSAVSAQQDEATKAQVFALHTPPEQAGAALAEIERLLAARKKSPGTTSGK